jgi:hypothetical protein
MDRKLATIQKISKIEPIEGKDKIVLATVLGWYVIVDKSFKEGDWCIYCEIDSVLPDKPVFEFLRKRCWFENESMRGHRIRTMKMSGVVSQGIIFPLSIIDTTIVYKAAEGMDVTGLLGVLKYELPDEQNKPKTESKPKKFWKRVVWEIKKLLPKKSWKYPNWVPKTDEDRIQNLPNQFIKFKNKYFYVTEKLDGSSATYALNKGKYYIMSRNLVRNVNGLIKLFVKGLNWTNKDNLQDEGIWEKISKKYGIEKILRKYGKNIAIQGEIIGEGIQKNKYKMSGIDFYVYGIFDINNKKYFNWDIVKEIVKELGLKTVPITDKYYLLQEEKTVDVLVKSAYGDSLIGPTIREGIVFRLLEDSDLYNNNKVSFKVISNEFLLKYGE